MAGYKLILKNSVPPTEEGRAKLKERLIQVLKLAPETAASIVTSLPAQLKRSLSFEQGQKYQELLLKLGGETELVPEEAETDIGLSFAAGEPAADETSVADEAAAELDELFQKVSSASAAAQDSTPGEQPEPAAEAREVQLPPAPVIEPPKEVQPGAPSARPLPVFALCGFAVAAALAAAWFYILRPPAPLVETPRLSAKQVEQLALKAKKLSQKQQPTETPLPLRKWQAAGKEGSLAYKVSVTGTGGTPHRALVELNAEQPPALTDQEVVQGVKRTWLKRFIAEELDKKVEAGTLQGTGYAYLSEGDLRLRVVGNATVQFDLQAEQPTVRIIVQAGDISRAGGAPFFVAYDAKGSILAVDLTVPLKEQTETGSAQQQDGHVALESK